MKITTAKQLQENIYKWQTKYLSGEVEWESAELIIQTLTVQYNATQTIKSMQDLFKEHTKPFMFSPYGINESVYMEQEEGSSIL